MPRWMGWYRDNYLKKRRWKAEEKSVSGQLWDCLRFMEDNYSGKDDRYSVVVLKVPEVPWRVEK
jgi:hypothetical protein